DSHLLSRSVSQVRLGVIRHLADFFGEMTPQQREKHLNVLVEVCVKNDCRSW
ncbi:unnamed protein product, partial [Scytosiphon promiscuus]